MKRIISIILLITILGCLTSCTSDENLEEILYYIEVDMAEFAEIEQKLNTSYNSMASSDTISDRDAYKQFMTTTMNLAIKLNDKATKLSYSIKNPELAEVHEICVEYTTVILSALSIMTSAVENSDFDLIEEGNIKIKEAENLADEYSAALENLVKKYGLELEK